MRTVSFAAKGASTDKIPYRFSEINDELIGRAQPSYSRSAQELERVYLKARSREMQRVCLGNWSTMTSAAEKLHSRRSASEIDI